jgi:hypothetical protein
MRLTRVITVVAGFVLVACQSDRPVASRGGRISADISDGAHQADCSTAVGTCVPGNAHFFFLPPMVKAPTTTGVFNAILAPSVTICLLSGNDCVANTSFSPGAAQLDATGQQYKVNWNTDPATVTVGKTYRVIVSTSGVELGFADVMPMSNGSQLKNMDTGEFIGLVDGRTLPIKFRIEQGATCSGRTDCLEQTVGPNPGARRDVVTPTLLAGVSFPPGYLTQAVTLTIAQVSEGCFTPSRPSPSFTDHGCYSFTTSPRVDNPLNCTAQPGEAPATPDDLVRCARVEVCPTIGPGDARYHDLRMFKSDPGTPVQELPEAPASLLAGDCPPFVPPGGGDGLGLALDGWRSVMHAIGRLVMPRPLFAASAMAHTGLGGMTCCFSNIGWALTARFDNVSAPLTLDIGGLEGTATVSVSNGTGAPASGLEVKGFIVQGTARRSAGTSRQTNGLFTCASGSCTLEGFNFVANNALDGTGTLVCGPASAEFDLMQDGVLVQTTTTGITLSDRGGCGE